MEWSGVLRRTVGGDLEEGERRREEREREEHGKTRNVAIIIC